MLVTVDEREITISEVPPRDPVRAQLARFEGDVIRASYTYFMSSDLADLVATGQTTPPWMALLHPQGSYLVARTRDGRIAGTIDIHMPNHLGHAIVEPLMVRPDLHRRGVGRRLWLAAEAIASGWSARQIGAWSIDANLGARAFYLDRGCRPIGDTHLEVGAVRFHCEFLAKTPRPPDSPYGGG